VRRVVSTAESVILIMPGPLSGKRCDAKLRIGSNQVVVRRLRVGSNRCRLRARDSYVARHARLRPAAVWPIWDARKIASGEVQDPRNRLFQVKANGL
jgi:hypothetical protein